MWEHLSNLELYEQWIYVFFNLPQNDERVQRTLFRLEEALQARRDRDTLKVDDVLPSREPDTRREPEAPDLVKVTGTG